MNVPANRARVKTSGSRSPVHFIAAQEYAHSRRLFHESTHVDQNMLSINHGNLWLIQRPMDVLDTGSTIIHSFEGLPCGGWRQTIKRGSDVDYLTRSGQWKHCKVLQNPTVYRGELSIYLGYQERVKPMRKFLVPLSSSRIAQSLKLLHSPRRNGLFSEHEVLPPTVWD